MARTLDGANNSEKTASHSRVIANINGEFLKTRPVQGHIGIQDTIEDQGGLITARDSRTGIKSWGPLYYTSITMPYK